MGGAGYRFADGNYMAFNIGETGAGKSVAIISNARAQQRFAIESVESGEVALKTNKQKGNYGEMKMDDYFESQGYERISKTLVTSLDDKLSKGIDGVYENANPPPQYVIAEAKYNTAQLSNTKRSGKQMSDKWIDSENRLVDAVGMDKADEIMTEIMFNQDNVEKILVKVNKNGDIVKSNIGNNGYLVK